MVALVLVASGCGGDVDPNGESSAGDPGGGNPGPSGPGGGGPGGRGPGGGGPGAGGPGGALDCDEIAGGANPEGEPCRNEGEACHWAWECISGDIVCEGGAWKTVAFDDGVPDCSDPPPASGAPCSRFCGVPSCAYTVQTPCGPETIETTCGPVGWSYPVACAGDCTAYVTADACGGNPACVWIGNCDGGVHQCVRNASCTPGDCLDGQTCIEMGINPCDPTALECEQCGALVSLCLPG
jgi:hypothetical protein